MNYKNAKQLLPQNLLEQIQKYAEGEIIYIPRKKDKRAGWGVVNGTKIKMEIRNREIKRLYQTGITIDELSEKFYLSEHTIRKVLSKKDISQENITASATDRI